MLTERENLLLQMALIYAHANVDDLNEAFANEIGGVTVHSHATGVHKITDQITVAELSDLCEKLTELKLS